MLENDKCQGLLMSGSNDVLSGVDLAAPGTQSKTYISLPFGYLLDHVSDWEAFCQATGLNPGLINAGLASSNDVQPVSVSTLKQYGVLPA